MRRKFLPSLLLILGAVLGVGLLLSSMGLVRSLSPGSKLGWFETRIESVEAEFMRRSPELRTNFDRFRECLNRASCYVIPILQERDVLLRRYWPEILDRLTVSDDWGEASITAEHHARFQRNLQKAGGPEKAKRCFPEVHYYRLGNGDTIYTFEGIRCP